MVGVVWIVACLVAKRRALGPAVVCVGVAYWAECWAAGLVAAGYLALLLLSLVTLKHLGRLSSSQAHVLPLLSVLPSQLSLTVISAHSSSLQPVANRATATALPASSNLTVFIFSPFFVLKRSMLPYAARAICAPAAGAACGKPMLVQPKSIQVANVLCVNPPVCKKHMACEKEADVWPICQ